MIKIKVGRIKIFLAKKLILIKRTSINTANKSLSLSKITAESVDEIGKLCFLFKSNDLIANPDPPGVPRKACDDSQQ